MMETRDIEEQSTLKLLYHITGLTRSEDDDVRYDAIVWCRLRFATCWMLAGLIYIVYEKVPSFFQEVPKARVVPIEPVRCEQVSGEKAIAWSSRSIDDSLAH
jgi:hypothetical protein